VARQLARRTRRTARGYSSTNRGVVSSQPEAQVRGRPPARQGVEAAPPPGLPRGMVSSQQSRPQRPRACAPTRTPSWAPRRRRSSSSSSCRRRRCLRRLRCRRPRISHHRSSSRCRRRRRRVGCPHSTASWQAEARVGRLPPIRVAAYHPPAVLLAAYHHTTGCPPTISQPRRQWRPLRAG